MVYVIFQRIEKEGCILGMSVGENMTLCNLKKYENKFKSLDKKKKQRI